MKVDKIDKLTHETDGNAQKRTLSRRNTATTASLTAQDILEDFSLSQASSVTGKPEDDVDFLIDIFTKKVVDQLAKAALEDASRSSTVSSSWGESANSLVSIDAMAEIIVESVQKIREQSLDTNEHSVSPSKASSQQSSKGSSKSSRDSSKGDVWHEDFWCADVAEFEDGAFETTTLPSGSTEGSSTRSDSISKKVESEDDDACSVISELSGLTGVFSALTVRQQQERQDFINKVNAENQVLSKYDARESSVVGFDVLNVREYERIPGDNPSCSSGPSLAIGWAFAEHGDIRVNDFESLRTGRRKGKQLILTREQRERILRRFGYTEKEIAESVRLVNKARNQRKQTVNNLGLMRIEESMEFARKKMKSILSLSRRHA